MLFKLPKLLLAEVRNWRAINRFLRRFPDRLRGSRGGRRHVCHPAIGQMTNKRHTPLQASPAKYPCRYSFCCG